jgi:hypothetical protein
VSAPVLTEAQRGQLQIELGRLINLCGIDNVVREAVLLKAMQARSLNPRALGINARALKLNSRELKLVGLD